MGSVTSESSGQWAAQLRHSDAASQQSNIFSPSPSHTAAAPLIILIPISNCNFQILIPVTPPHYCTAIGTENIAAAATSLYFCNDTGYVFRLITFASIASIHIKKKMKLLLGTRSKCGCLHEMVITMMFTSSWHPLIVPAPCPRPVVAGAEGVLLWRGPAQGNYKLIKWITQNNFNAGLCGVNNLGTTVNIQHSHSS